MEEDTKLFREAWNTQWREFRSLPFKPVFIILSVTIIQIIARFHTSRFAFRKLLGVLTVQEPYSEFYEYCLWMLGDFVLQFPLLLVCILYIFKDSPSKFGIQKGDSRLGLKVIVLFWVCMVPILWFVSADPSFLKLHPAPLLAKTQWGMFWLYELCSVIYIIGWEFVWRGYMLFGLKEYLGYYAVLIQAIPFTLLHFGAPELETYSALVAGIGLGMIAVATRSFWYGTLAHALVLGTMDVVGALRGRAAISGVGFRDIIEIITKNF